MPPRYFLLNEGDDPMRASPPRRGLGFWILIIALALLGIFLASKVVKARNVSTTSGPVIPTDTFQEVENQPFDLPSPDTAMLATEETSTGEPPAASPDMAMGSTTPTASPTPSPVVQTVIVEVTHIVQSPPEQVEVTRIVQSPPQKVEVTRIVQGPQVEIEVTRIVPVYVVVTATPTPSPTPTTTPGGDETPTASPTPTPTDTPEGEETPMPSPTPEVEETPTPTATPEGPED